MSSQKNLLRYTGKCIYFVQVENNELFIIGKSASIKITFNRIRSESNKSVKLYNILKIYDDNNDDKMDEELNQVYIHFHKSRVDDELFKISKEDIDDYIESKEYIKLIDTVDNMRNDIQKTLKCAENDRNSNQIYNNIIKNSTKSSSNTAKSSNTTKSSSNTTKSSNTKSSNTKSSSNTTKISNFICKRCRQEFTKKYNYERHLSRKNPCKVKYILEENEDDEVDNINNIKSMKTQLVNSMITLKDLKIQEKEIKIKTLKQQNAMLKTTNKKIKKKNKKLSTQLVNTHQPFQQSVHLYDQRSVNQTNHIYTTSNNVNVNNFGKENIEYIDESTINNYLLEGPQGNVKLFQEIHMHPEHPENHNVIYIIDDDKFLAFESGNWHHTEKDTIARMHLQKAIKIYRRHLNNKADSIHPITDDERLMYNETSSYDADYKNQIMDGITNKFDGRQIEYPDQKLIKN